MLVWVSARLSSKTRAWEGLLTPHWPTWQLASGFLVWALRDSRLFRPRIFQPSLSAPDGRYSHLPASWILPLPTGSRIHRDTDTNSNSPSCVRNEDAGQIFNLAYSVFLSGPHGPSLTQTTRRVFRREAQKNSDVFSNRWTQNEPIPTQLLRGSWGRQKKSARWCLGSHSATVLLSFPLGSGPDSEIYCCQLSSGGLKCAVMYLLSLLAALFCCPWMTDSHSLCVDDIIALCGMQPVYSAT